MQCNADFDKVWRNLQWTWLCWRGGIRDLHIALLCCCPESHHHCYCLHRCYHCYCYYYCCYHHCNCHCITSLQLQLCPNAKINRWNMKFIYLETRSLGALRKLKEKEEDKFRKYQNHVVRNTVRSFGQIQLTIFEKYSKRRSDPDLWKCSF